MSEELRALLADALSPLPGESGGISIVMATADLPPAMALLSTGDVYLEGDQVRVGIHATSSAVERLGGGFSLLVPLDTMAVRVEVVDASAHRGGALTMLEGTIRAIRPTSEPPWRLRMTFEPEPSPKSAVEPHIAYWRSVREWLDGTSLEPPELPRT